MSKFIIYTYQFSPIQTSGIGLFDDDRIPVDELMAKKQEIFGAIRRSSDLSQIRYYHLALRIRLMDTRCFLMKWE